MRWVEHEARMGRIRTVDNDEMMIIKTDFRGVGCKGMKWTELD
jgi:hypothetical protein